MNRLEREAGIAPGALMPSFIVFVCSLTAFALVGVSAILGR